MFFQTALNFFFEQLYHLDGTLKRIFAVSHWCEFIVGKFLCSGISIHGIGRRSEKERKVFQGAANELCLTLNTLTQGSFGAQR